jgi:hypothetical protein
MKTAQLFFVLVSGVIVIGKIDAQNVGIGTTTPTEKLEVNGNIMLPLQKIIYLGGRPDVDESGSRISRSSYSQNLIFENTDGGHAFRTFDGVQQTNRLIIQGSNRYVGIGNGPIVQLHVEGNVFLPFQKSYYIGGWSEQGENGTRLHYNLNNTYVDNKGGDIYFRVDNGDGSTPHMMIKGTNGNAGIGTTNPSATLDANGSAKVGGNVDVSGNTVITGNLGIGAIVPSAKLDVAGNARISGNTSIQFGNLGVGTTSPSHKLNVVGSIRTSYSGTYVTPAPLAANSDYLIPLVLWYNPLPTGSTFTNLLYVSPSDGARVMITQAKVVNETTLNITVGTIEAGLARLNWASSNSERQETALKPLAGNPKNHLRIC